MAKQYVTPTVEPLVVRIEQGYSLSVGEVTVTGGCEGLRDNARIAFGSSEPYDNGSNMEGIGDNGALFF